MTYYGKPCWDDCKKKGNSEYHYCTGMNVYDSKIQKGKQRIATKEQDTKYFRVFNLY